MTESFGSKTFSLRFTVWASDGCCLFHSTFATESHTKKSTCKWFLLVVMKERNDTMTQDGERRNWKVKLGIKIKIKCFRREKMHAIIRRVRFWDFDPVTTVREKKYWWQLWSFLFIAQHVSRRQQSPNCPNSLLRKGGGTKKYKKAEKDDCARTCVIIRILSVPCNNAVGTPHFIRALGVFCSCFAKNFMKTKKLWRRP